MKIGYQGIEGSYSEKAAKEFIAKLGYINVQLVPLVTSHAVVEALKTNKVDYGVAASFNSIVGIVEETSNALNNENIDKFDTIKIPIHLSLYKKSEEIPNERLTMIGSHTMALKETRLTRAGLILYKVIPILKELNIEDTAIAAKWLSEGTFVSERTAVICSKEAGELYGLSLIKENIEDRKDNETTFSILKMK